MKKLNYYPCGKRFLVRKSGEVEECSNGIASWGCAHSGDIENLTNDSQPYQTVHILDGNEATFYFVISQNENERSDTEAPILSIFVNGVLKGTYTQDNVGSNESTTNGSFGEDYQKSYFLKVACDEHCQCSFERSSIPSCDIHANLSFPDDPGVYGYHND